MGIRKRSIHRLLLIEAVKPSAVQKELEFIEEETGGGGWSDSDTDFDDARKFIIELLFDAKSGLGLKDANTEYVKICDAEKRQHAGWTQIYHRGGLGGCTTAHQPELRPVI